MRKKILSILLCAAMLCSTQAFAVSPTQNAVKTYGDYEYLVLSDQTIKLTDYYGAAEALGIPSEIDGMPVTVLGERLIAGNFSSGNTTLQTVTIPDTVRELEPYVFYGCHRLKSVRLPAGLKTIPEHAFTLCDNLREIKLPEGLERIERFAFSLTELKSVILPDTLTYLGEDALHVSQTIRIGARLRSIGRGNYAGQGYLVSDQNPYLTEKDGVLYDKSMRTLVYYPLGMREFTVPKGVREIGKNAFWDAYPLRKITLPEGLIRIGDNAFKQQNRLRTIVIPDSVREIGRGAFSECSRLKTLQLPKSLKTIGNYAFKGTKIKKLYIPDGTKQIGNYAFSRSYNLAHVRIPNSVTSIGKGAFYHCESLKSVTLPKGVRLGKRSFGYYEHVDYGSGMDGDTAITTVKRIKGFTVYGKNGSSAKRYAKANRFKFAKTLILGLIKVRGVKNKSYTGEAVKQSIKVTRGGKTLKLNKDYFVTYEDNVERGKAHMRICGTGKYSGVATKTFKIK